MSERTYKLPALSWLRVTDFLLGWLEYELGGGVRVNNKRVVCLQHLDGARAALRMETVDDTMEPEPVGSAMSATRYNCVTAGLALNPEVVQQLYGISEEELALFVPIECPRLTLTASGVLRPWTSATCFGQKQSTALNRLLREAFWQAVGEFSEQYARQRQGEKYAQEEMIEAFCKETGTDDIHVPALRREWQRRCKRADSPP